MTSKADADLEKLSLAWERQTGYDSIPTIKRIYEQTASGAYKCVWPGCRYARLDVELVWRHVHSAHGNNSLPPGIAALAQAEQEQA